MFSLLCNRKVGTQDILGQQCPECNALQKVIISLPEQIAKPAGEIRYWQRREPKPARLAALSQGSI